MLRAGVDIDDQERSTNLKKRKYDNNNIDNNDDNNDIIPQPLHEKADDSEDSDSSDYSDSDTDDDSDDSDDNSEKHKNKVLLFRNYNPHDTKLKVKRIPKYDINQGIL